MSYKHNYTFHVLLATIGYSLYSIFLKIAITRGINGLFFIGIASSIAAVFYWIKVIVNREKLNTVSLPLVMCVIANILICYYEPGSMRYISVSLFNIIYFSYPMFVALIGRVIFGHQIGSRKAVCLIMAMVGLSLAIGVFESSIQFHKVGVIMAIVCGIANAAYFLSQQKLYEKITYNVALAYNFTATAAFVAISCAKSGNLVNGFEPRDIALVMAFAIVSIILPSFLMAYGINKIGPVKASIINLMQPVITLALAKLLFDDMMTASQMLGCAVVIISVGLMALGGTEKKYIESESRVA